MPSLLRLSLPLPLLAPHLGTHTCQTVSWDPQGCLHRMLPFCCWRGRFHGQTLCRGLRGPAPPVPLLAAAGQGRVSLGCRCPFRTGHREVGAEVSWRPAPAVLAARAPGLAEHWAWLLWHLLSREDSAPGDCQGRVLGASMKHRRGLLGASVRKHPSQAEIIVSLEIPLAEGQSVGLASSPLRSMEPSTKHM